jgi:hypothetical protein
MNYPPGNPAKRAAKVRVLGLKSKAYPNVCNPASGPSPPGEARGSTRNT